MAEEVKQLCNRREYLEGVYPILASKAEDIQNLYITTERIFDEALFFGNNEMRARLVDALQKDMENLDGEVIANEIPLAQISYEKRYEEENRSPINTELDYQKTDNNYVYECYYAYVYPSFVNTIAVLKEAGYDLAEKITAADVEKIQVRYPGSDSEEDDEIITYTDEAEIEQLLDALVYTPLATDWYKYEEYTASVVLKQEDGGVENGDTWEESGAAWLIRSDKLPAFLAE